MCRSCRRHTRTPCRVRRVSSDTTAPLGLCVASPVRLCQSRHWRRRASAESRASRRADRTPTDSSCLRRSCRRHTRTPCRVRRVSSDITAPLALCVASPVRLCQSLHRKGRASAEPRASCRADRAPPISSCLRRSCRRHTRALSCAPSSADQHHRASCFPRLIAGSALSVPMPATPSERRAASEPSCRPSAAGLVVRAPIVPSTHARAVSCAPCVE